MAITFISHGRSEAEVEQAGADLVRTRLVERLKGPEQRVRVDDLLPAAADWRWTLNVWMAECDVAVVLVTRGGMDKPWLKREVNILLWRLALGAPLTVLPVLLGGLQPRDLRKTEISQLVTRQMIIQGVEESEEDLVDRIVAALGDLPRCADTSAMQSMAAKVEHCLDEVKQAFPLQEMARELGGRQQPFPEIREGRRFIAYQFLDERPTEVVPKAIKKVAFYLDPDRLEKLINLAVPTWIDPVAVRRLLPEDGQVVVTLGTERSDTARQHIDRASCFSDDYWVQVVALVAGEAQLAENLIACERAVGELFGGDVDTEPPDDDVLFLVIDPHGTEPGVAGELVRELTARFSRLNVVVLTGDAGPEDLGEQHCRTLHIAVPPGTEDGVAQTVKALKRIFARRKDLGKDLGQ
ncbi:hypothetical protein ABZ078_29735 [Streptomyces sp. NPDC006385]|uniref:hypothetical protein n=1 Tax=Streptomyces sp. NPDC006385 TaxID=3156761 RepID=UPI0033A8B7FD